MLKVQEIRELIKLIDQSSLDELEYEQEGCKIKLRKNNNAKLNQVVVPQQIPQVNDAPKVNLAQEPVIEKNEPNENKIETASDKNLHKIESPMVGTFYSAPSPDQDDYVKVGDKITPDSIVCIVEAMKLFNEIEAEVKGEIVEILVENGQLVEYGQPLFLVKAE